MLIGITGNARNGKDTVGDILVKRCGFEKRSLAKPLKDACKIIFNWDERHVNGDLKDVEDKEYGISPRLVMQLLGTEFAQNGLCEHSQSFAQTTGRGLWVKRCLQKIDGKNIVITDVRFLHEEKAIREHGGRIIRVIRPGFEGHSNHSSETEMSKIVADATIINDCSLDELEWRVYSVCKMLSGVV